MDTSYEEVANELIADIAAEVAAGGWSAPHGAVPKACWCSNLFTPAGCWLSLPVAHRWQLLHSTAYPAPLPCLMRVAGTAEAATDEKNIRRRCYDALVGAAAAAGGWQQFMRARAMAAGPSDAADGCSPARRHWCGTQCISTSLCVICNPRKCAELECWRLSPLLAWLDAKMTRWLARLGISAFHSSILHVSFFVPSLSSRMCWRPLA